MKKHWIETRIEELRDQGITVRKKDVGDALSLSGPSVTKMLNFKREIPPSEYPILADVLNMSADDVFFIENGYRLGDASFKTTSLIRIPLVGFVKAGDWQEALEMPKDDWTYFEMAPDQRYGELQAFGLKVVGPSIEKKIPEGAVAICVSFQELDREPVHGELVVVHRHRHGLTEATIKEYRINNGKPELWPLSFHPDYQKPIVPGEIGQNGDTIIVHALVIGAHHIL